MQAHPHTGAPAPVPATSGPGVPDGLPMPTAQLVPARAVGAPLAEPSPSTLALYAADWARFVRWCRVHGHTALPATPEAVATFLTEIAPGRSRGSLGRLHAAINAAHRRAGLPAPRVDAAAHRELRAAGKRRRASAPPPSASALTRMAARCPRDTAGLRDRALLLLVAALPGGRRIGADGHPGTARRALLGLDAEDVRFTPAGATLNLHAQGGTVGPDRSVALTRGADTSSCPVRALEDWLRASAGAFGPVFRKVDRWGNVEHGRLHPDAWNRILLRRGGASTRAGRGG